MTAARKSAGRATKPGAARKTPAAAKAAPAAPKRPAADWERIETLYRAGAASVREIAAEAGVSHTAINNRAKREEWGRDLQAKIRAKADAKVSKAMVSTEVSTETKLTEAVVVEVEAQVQARIRLTHRTDVAKGRTLAMKLLAELEHQTENVDLYDDLFDLVHETTPDEDSGRDRLTKLRQAYERALSLSGRTKTMKDLADTLRVLIALEREAFGLDAEGGGGGDKTPADLLREFLGSLHGNAGRLPIAKSPPQPGAAGLVKG